VTPLSSAAASEPNFSPDDVLRGIKATRERCDEPGRLWVDVDGPGDCLRFYGASAGPSDTPPLIFFEGDVVQHRAGPRTDPPSWEVIGVYGQLSPAIKQSEAEQYSAATARTFVNPARPGVLGSSGHHLERRREREVGLVDRAVDLLKLKFGWTRIDLAGLSGGGHLVAALMARRDDIRCALIASGNVAVRERLREFGLAQDVTGYADFVDPIDHVCQVARHPPRKVVFLTDPADRIVSAASQGAYVSALRSAGVAVEQRLVSALDPEHHVLRLPAIMAALACHPD
jgi:pimeloyl-ACP methyl ester carboxylesterase